MVAVLVLIALARGGVHAMREAREARERQAARLALLADARRAAEERARARVVAPAPPALAAAPVVGLTAVFEKLEQSARFARQPTPLPTPPARMPRASVPPPIPPQARRVAPRPRMPEGAYPIVRPKR